MMITTTTLTSTTVQAIVEGGCSFLSLLLILFVVTMWHQERTSMPEYGRGFTGHSSSWTNFTLVSIYYLSTPDYTNRRGDN